MDGLEHQRAKYKGLLSIFLRWSERRAAKRSQLLVADNPEIARYLAKYNTPTQTIAYGSHVVETPENAAKILEETGLPTHNFHVHIGRVQPDNHVWEILAAAEESGAIPLSFEKADAQSMIKETKLWQELGLIILVYTRLILASVFQRLPSW